MNVLLCGSLGAVEREVWARALRAALGTRHRLVQDREEVDASTIEAAIVANPSPGSLSGLPRLGLIQSLWAGVDRLLADATLPPGVPIARMVDPAMNDAMAETVLWSVLSLHRGYFSYSRQQSAGVWRVLPQRRADEVEVLVLGFGQMGRTAALRVARLGYAVTAWSRAPRDAADPGVRLVHGWAGLAKAAERARIVVNLLPLTDDTRGVLGAALFNRLQERAGIVNLARGAHLVESELLAALASGRVDHAVLDVFAREPLPAGHPFWSHPQVTVLPHAAAQTDPRTAAAVAARNIGALESGGPIVHRVDRERGY